MENDNSIKNNKAAGDCDRLPYILIKSHSFLKNIEIIFNTNKTRSSLHKFLIEH